MYIVFFLYFPADVDQDLDGNQMHTAWPQNKCKKKMICIIQIENKSAQNFTITKISNGQNGNYRCGLWVEIVTDTNRATFMHTHK